MWVRVDDDVIEHPKTDHLARILDVPRVAATGLLQAVWGFAARHHRDGDLTRVQLTTLHRRIGWTTGGIASADSPRALLSNVMPDVREVLVEAGWADRLPDGRIVLHDWEEHQGRFIEKMQKERERKRLAREKTSADKRRTRARTVRAPEKSVRGHSAPNDTVRSTPYIPHGGPDARASTNNSETPRSPVRLGDAVRAAGLQ